MDKDTERNKWIGVLRRNYFAAVAVVVVLLLTGALAVWGTGLECLALAQADASTAYICSALAILMTLAFMPLGLKWPFLGVVHRWMVANGDEVILRYAKAYRIRLCILLLPVVICWGCLVTNPTDSGFCLLAVSAFPYLMVCPGIVRLKHELGEDKDENSSMNEEEV